MNEIITLPTEIDDLKLKQLTTEDATSYFNAVEANRDHLSQFEDETADKYPDLNSVKDSIINPKDPTKLRFGIWKGNIFVGSINVKPDEEGAEIGYWLDSRHTGHGYATLALNSIGRYAAEHIGKPHAWVKRKNSDSVAVLERAGYRHARNTDDEYIFEIGYKEEPSIIETEQDGLVLREMTSVKDDKAIYEVQVKNRDRISRYGNNIYETVGDITDARLTNGWIRFGIYKDAELIGLQAFKPSDNGKEAEIGTWLKEEAEGHGYATSCRRALSEQLALQYERVFAETSPDNEKARKSLELSGYHSTGKMVDRDWGIAEVFEFKK